jgi:hypothetical protein
MYLYLASAVSLRKETDEITIQTLIRKGWTQIPDPEVPGSEWNGVEWGAPAPEPSTPRWVEFGLALGANAGVNQWYHALFTPQTSILHGMIAVGLGQAAKGDPQTFLGGWTQCRALGLVSADLLAGVVAMAAEYDLPEEFISALSD